MSARVCSPGVTLSQASCDLQVEFCTGAPDTLVMNMGGSECRALGICKQLFLEGDLEAQEQTTCVESI